MTVRFNDFPPVESAATVRVEVLEGRTLLSAQPGGGCSEPLHQRVASVNGSLAIESSRSTAMILTQGESGPTHLMGGVGEYDWPRSYLTRRVSFVGRGWVTHMVRVALPWRNSPLGVTIQPVAGQPFSAVVATVRVSSPSPPVVGIGWGDGDEPASEATAVSQGAGFYQIIGSHTYAKRGRYRISVSVISKAPPDSTAPDTFRIIRSTARVSAPPK